MQQKGNMNDNTCLTRQDICKILKISRSTFDRLLVKNLFPKPAFTFGRIQRWTREQLNEKMPEHSTKTSYSQPCEMIVYFNNMNPFQK